MAECVICGQTFIPHYAIKDRQKTCGKACSEQYHRLYVNGHGITAGLPVKPIWHNLECRIVEAYTNRVLEVIDMRGWGEGDIFKAWDRLIELVQERNWRIET